MANDIVRVKIPCRIIYPRLSEATLNEKSGKMEYSVVCVLDKDEDEDMIKTLRKAMKDSFVAKFGDDRSRWAMPFKKDGFFEEHLSDDGKDGFFLRDGEFTEKEYFENKVFVTIRDAARAPKTPNRPECGVVVGKGKFKRLHGAEIDEEIYGGCYGIVVADIRAYENKESNSKGVSAYLKAVMKTADGERIGGGAPVNMEEMFGEEVSEDSALEGIDDL